MALKTWMISLRNNIHAKEFLHFTYIMIGENVNFSKQCWRLWMIFLCNKQYPYVRAKGSLHFTYVTIDGNVNFPSNEGLDNFPS